MELFCRIYLTCTFIFGAGFILAELCRWSARQIRRAFYDIAHTIAMKEKANMLMEYQKHRKEFIRWLERKK